MNKTKKGISWARKVDLLQIQLNQQQSFRDYIPPDHDMCLDIAKKIDTAKINVQEQKIKIAVVEEGI